MNLYLLLVIVAAWMFFGWISQAVQQARKSQGAAVRPHRGQGRATVRRPSGRTEEPLPVAEHKEKVEPGPQETASRRQRERPAELGESTRLREETRRLSPQSVVMGVVMSEVLGPPRCHNPHRPPAARGK